MKKRITAVFIAAALVMTLFAGSRITARAEEAADAGTVVEAGGISLEIPAEYAELVTVRTEDLPDDMLFTVSETASIEAAEAQGWDDDHAGFLFGISTVDYDKAREMRCYDMSGLDIFADDGNGTYYVFNHATDVTFVREQYEDIDEDMEQFSRLNEWAFGEVRDAIVAENEGLTPHKHSNTEVDIFLARAAFMEDANYTVSMLDYGPLEANLQDNGAYLQYFLEGVTFAYSDDEIPDGEYVVLNFPDDNERFDFFLAEDKQNYVRCVTTYDDGSETEYLYKAEFEDEDLTAASIMEDWYKAIVEESGIASPDWVSGLAADKNASAICVVSFDEEGTPVVVRYGRDDFGRWIKIVEEEEYLEADEEPAEEVTEEAEESGEEEVTEEAEESGEEEADEEAAEEVTEEAEESEEEEAAEEAAEEEVTDEAEEPVEEETPAEDAEEETAEEESSTQVVIVIDSLEKLSPEVLSALGLADAAEEEETAALEDEEPAEEEEHELAFDFADCDTFTQIVDTKLEDGQGYANAELDGEGVLLVSTGTFDNEGFDAAIDADIFFYQDGAPAYLGYVASSGTAYPLAVKDGKLYVAGGHYVSKYTVTDGTLMLMEKAWEEFDSDGEATWYYTSSDGGDYEDFDQEMAKDILDRLFDEYMEAEVIEFATVVKE